MSALHESAAGVNLPLQPVSSSGGGGGNEQERHVTHMMVITVHFLPQEKIISVAHLMKQEMMVVSNGGGADVCPAACLLASVCLRARALIVTSDHLIIINSLGGI